MGVTDCIAAIYCRLSKEDIEKDPGKTVSESIKNQKSMLESYALGQNWTIHDFYIDEDYSGSDRNRPDFNRLITDSLLGCFNIVLCKNQARFARDIEYVEKYIHGLFAEQQIRFVAVLDHIDTGYVSRSARKASQINSLVDEWYLSDLSENIISALTTKRKNAEFIGSWAPYGYRKNPGNKNSLIIDPEAAEQVKRIFEWYKNGLGVAGIARELNSGLIPNPLLYKQRNGERINPNPGRLTEKRYLWSPSTISSILHNQTYRGCLVQGKYRKASYKSKKLLRVPKSEWIVIPECHEPIIDEEIWNSVQKKLESKCRSSLTKDKRITGGKVYCGECGARLVLTGGRSGKKNVTYYCCSRHKRSGNSCIGARIEAAKLEQILLERINSLSSSYFDEAWLLNQLDSDLISINSGSSALNAELITLTGRSASLERKKEILYLDKLNSIITEVQYLAYKKSLDREAVSIMERRREIMEELSCPEQPKTDLYKSILESFRTPRSLTRDMVDQLIDSVSIHKRKNGEPQQVTITWSF